jgi:hypothetical protein
LEGKRDATGLSRGVEGEGATALEPGDKAAACVGVAEVGISVGDTEGRAGQGQAPIRFPPLLKDHSIAAETIGSGCTIELPVVVSFAAPVFYLGDKVVEGGVGEQCVEKGLPGVD